VKTFVATVKTKRTEKWYVKAKNAQEAQRALADNVTPKRAKGVDIEFTFGDVRETEEKVFEVKPTKKKAVKRAKSRI
jgi:hypothetical protein